MKSIKIAIISQKVMVNIKVVLKITGSHYKKIQLTHKKINLIYEIN